jgi:pimeloyl-ACP methyl ester carboxylesterase
MSSSFRSIMLVFFALLAVLAGHPAGAQQSGAVYVPSSAKYEFLARWDVERLNQILSVDMPKFAGIPTSFTPARNAVKLYRVTYASVVPERDNMPIVATGLLAVPDTGATSFPMVSYQHGTVYEKQQVPSFPEQSDETRLMIAQFAGQGYIVIGADYFGMGASREPEGYGVKASHQQATLDMLLASRAVLDEMKLSASKLFLTGWSLGGFVTFSMLEKLETIGIPVQAVGTASAPADMFALLNGFLQFPRKIDADWVGFVYVLTAFSFEHYHGIPGLARGLFTDSAYEVARKLYFREPVDAAQVPKDLKSLIRPEYFDARKFAASAYGRLAQQMQAHRWVVQTPARAYFGEADEVIRNELGQLPMTYQKTIGNDRVEAIPTGATNHRGTFVTAVPQWKAWFDAQ